MLSFLARDKAAHKPRNGAADGYLFDLDASQRFVRLRTGIDVFPSHNNAGSFAKLGQISGFLPQMDSTIWAQSYGKMPSGPIVSAIPANLQWQITIPGLNKYSPQS